jgi:hypothetical protein
VRPKNAVTFHILGRLPMDFNGFCTGFCTDVSIEAGQPTKTPALYSCRLIHIS